MHSLDDNVGLPVLKTGPTTEDMLHAAQSDRDRLKERYDSLKKTLDRTRAELAEMNAVMAPLGKFYRGQTGNVFRVISVTFRPKDEVLNIEPEPSYRMICITDRTIEAFQATRGELITWYTEDPEATS